MVASPSRTVKCIFPPPPPPPARPNSCTEYPANGNIVFYDISIEWESGAVLTPASWSVQQFQPACNSNGKVLNATSLEFTWDVK